MKATIGFATSITEGGEPELSFLTGKPDKYVGKYDFVVFSDELIYPNDIPEDVGFYVYGEIDKDGMIKGSIKLFHESAKEMANEHYDARKTAINVKYSNIRELVADKLECPVVEIGQRLFEMDKDIEGYAEENEIVPVLLRKSFLILLGG